ncbi:MAG TPA: DUF2235 domain-containing protein [Xanthobacteraceae bacterium]|nr:DUF2235 domain-containing protein [Xanthobacteraceae bacterium]
MDSERADLIFTDPPYNVPIDGHATGLGRIRHRNFAMASGEMSVAAFTDFLQQTLGNAAAKARDGAIAFVCMDWRHMGELHRRQRAAQNAPSRTFEQVEQRWFIGAHANVGGGYPSDVLAQAPLKWLMDKAAAHGLRFRSDFKVDPADPAAPVADSYTSFGPALLRLFSKRFYRPVGAEPAVGTKRTTSRINETIDASVFEKWRSNPAYRPPNLQAWAERFKLDPASLTETVLASNPEVVIAHPQPAVPSSSSGA